jgi:linoleoyl-CoA desaturase
VKKRVYNFFKGRSLSRQDHWLLYVKLVVTLAGFFGAWYAVMMCGLWYVIPVWGFFNAMIGIQIMHDANHGAFSKNLLWNRILGWSIDFIGGSSLIWRSEHNLGHHIHTNHDNDPDTTSGWPLIRFNPSTGHRWWHQYQHIYVWFMYAVVAGRWYFNDFSLMSKLPSEQRIDAPQYEWTAFWTFKVTKYSFFFFFFRN